MVCGFEQWRLAHAIETLEEAVITLQGLRRAAGNAAAESLDWKQLHDELDGAIGEAGTAMDRAGKALNYAKAKGLGRSKWEVQG